MDPVPVMVSQKTDNIEEVSVVYSGSCSSSSKPKNLTLQRKWCTQFTKESVRYVHESFLSIAGLQTMAIADDEYITH